MRRNRCLGAALALACLLAGLIPTARAADEAGWPTISSGVGPKGMDFVDANHGWVVGAAGNVDRTIDGGATWTRHWSGTRSTLLAIDFVDGQYGWAVGADSTVVTTRDGGLTWTPQVARVTSSYPWLPRFTDVSFIDRDRGWLVTQYAALATIDGGRSWSLVIDNAESARYSLSAVEFVDQAHGWISAMQSSGPVVLRTVDGGQTWTPTGAGQSSGIYEGAIDFLDTMNGWVVGNYGIRVTHDGGVTWRRAEARSGPNTVDLIAVSFADALHGFAVGNHMFRTDDGGVNWVEMATPVPHGTGVVATDAGHVRITADANIVLTSDDGGQTWVTRRVAATTDQDLNGVHFVDQQHGWVVGDGGVIRGTVDGGLTWVDQVSGTTEKLRDVTFTDLLHGAAVGGDDDPPQSRDGVILTTADGGATWTRRAPATPDPPQFWKVFFLDAAHGWVAGDGGLQATSDGGQTWTRLGQFLYVRDVQFVDLQHGFVVMNAKVLVTTDGGLTWTTRDPFANLGSSVGGGALVAVQFLDLLHGWTAGGGRVLRTVDGGLTWTAPAIDFGQGIKAMSFPSATDGWIVGGTGVAMGTHDGGQTWRRVLTSVAEVFKTDPSTTFGPLFGLSFTDVDHGWAVGWKGSVLTVSTRDQVEAAILVDRELVEYKAGQPATLTVDVHARIGFEPAAGTPTPPAATPTGQVEVSRAGVVVGTLPLVDGIARWTTAPLVPGPQLFTARYLGDARYGPTPPFALWLSPTRPVLGWGYNGVGPLGTGTTTHSPVPVVAAVPFPGVASAWYNRIVEAAAGGFHSLTLAENGILYASGWNNFGQLGLGDTRDRLTPVRVIDFASVRNAAGGAFHSLAVTTDGKVWAWGWNGYGELGTPAGSNPTLPAEVVGLTDVATVAAGAVHSLALKADGTVWAWGWNGLGQLGDGTTTSRSAPVRVSGLTDVVAIAAGSHHSLAVKADGSVWAWGWNVQGQLGDGTTVDRNVPVRISGLSARSVSAGAYHSLAVRPDGTVAAWGWNGVGQLGDGTTVNRLRPVTAVGVSGTTAVAAGSYHSLALDSSGSVRSWGWNYFGQLGNGTTADRAQAALVPGLAGEGVLAAGSVHSLAM